MPGVTDLGFERATFEDIFAETTSHQRARISEQLDVTERTVIGNVDAIASDQLAQAWEVLEEAYNAFDPDNATDDRLVALALLAGVERRGATKGLVTATVNLAAGKTFAPGTMTAHVFDEPSNRWVNRDTVTSTVGTNYPAVFESESPGSAAKAAAGTLTVIASPVTGWNSITTAADATPGEDQESIEDLRARREQSLAQAGSGTVDAIRAELLQVAGVLAGTEVYENTDDVVVDGIPAHSIRAVVWDGSPPAANNAAIAQALYNNRAAGVRAFGALTGNAVSSDGQVVPVAFDRATVVQVYVDVDIVSAVGVSIADVKAAVLAAMPTAVGGDVVYNRIAAAVFAVPGVDNFDFVEIGTAPAPSGTANISIGSAQIAVLSSGNIVVTGDAT
jgi:uncharacterized phage protein gp47/JayE